MEEIVLKAELALVICLLCAIVFIAILAKNSSLSKKVSELVRAHENEQKRSYEEHHSTTNRLKRLHSKELDDRQSTIDNIKHDLDYLKDKYRHVINVDEEALVMKSNAESEAAKIVSEAEEFFENQKQLADSLLSNAEMTLDDARKKRKEANDHLEYVNIAAVKRSEKILQDANEKAIEIAQGAYEIRGKEKEMSAAIEAMNNVIQGYKDEYIVPNQSVLDDLADEYSFTEPGVKLKELRQEIRRLIKNELAGSCEYVEEKRKRYAVHFVVDAFNGKVDTALASVKHDNYGKLKQKIVDAFHLVNHNGKPFRDARITDTFLQVRLDELKWAVAVHEIKLKERMEQREHAEKIREETKAKREYEAALKKAAREEKMIADAIREAQKQFEAASSEERTQLESNIISLKQKLEEVEAQSERALSMAQQTKRGHVYIISNIGSFGERVYKIGMTRRLEPNDRVKELGDASVPFSFDIHAMIFSENAPELESHLHKLFNEYRVNKINNRKEFFNLRISDIRDAIERHGIENVNWTMRAKAAEYFESLVIMNKMQKVS